MKSKKDKQRKKQGDIRVQEAKSLPDRRITLISVALIIGLGFVVYANSLTGKFIWDDSYLVEKNEYIRNWSNLPEIFTSDVGAGGGMEYNFYRPLQILTYLIDYSFWKLNVLGYHLTNTLLHILAAVCVFWFIHLLFNNWKLALFTGILFVVHPVHTEAVAYISGRADSLALIFMLLCFVLYVKQVHQAGLAMYVLMLLSYVLALLSKEISLILPGLLLLYHYAFRKKFRAKAFLSVAGISVIYIWLRTAVLGSSIFPVSCPLSLFQRVSGFLVAITRYVKLLLLPSNLHMEYGYLRVVFPDPEALLGAGILFVLAIHALRARKYGRLIFFSIVWFLITLLPVANIYPVTAYMAEHWLYQPSIGFFLILAGGISFLYERKRLPVLALGLVTVLTVVYSYLTIRQNNYWKEPITFYERTLRYTRGNARVYFNLGYEYARSGNKKRATELYEKALELDPDFVGVYTNLGILYQSEGQDKQAIEMFKKAAEIDPDNPKVYCNLGLAYAGTGNRDEAITAYQKAIQIDPGFVDGYCLLGNVYKDAGKKEKAAAFYRRAAEINPGYATAYNNLGLLYYHDGQYDLAIKYFDRADELGYEVHPEILKALQPYRER